MAPWPSLAALAVALAAASEPPWRCGEALRAARRKLEAAFAGPTVKDFSSLDFESLSAAMNLMQEVAGNVNRVMHAGYVKVLHNQEGEVVYELTADDEWAVEEYTLKYVFVLADLIPLVFASPVELRSALSNELGHPLLKRQRILSTLRVSWYTMLTNQSCWSVPFFGALSALARRLSELPEFEPDADPYRVQIFQQLDLPWQGPISSISYGNHLKMQGEPMMNWEATREKTFRKACAFLATAKGRAGIEVAERYFRIYHQDSLGIVLYAAAQWPVFDLLHRLALRPRVEDDVLKSEDSEADEESFEEFFVEAGKQRLSPDLALEFYRMFHVVGTLFNAMRVQWWVSHGTLIGALRDRGLSRHADDCEIDVSERDVELMQSVGMKAALSRNGYELSYDPRGRCFKVWPSGSRQAEPREAQLVDQSWWLPQQRVGTPALDIYVVQTPEASQSERYYISNDVFHCNTLSCTQYWTRWELSEFYDVPFGLSTAKVPRGAAWYLDRVYGADWNVTVRPHNYASQHGEGFEPMDVSLLKKRAAEPFGPLPLVL